MTADNGEDWTALWPKSGICGFSDFFRFAPACPPGVMSGTG
jgi:hypothetical protein